MTQEPHDDAGASISTRMSSTVVFEFLIALGSSESVLVNLYLILL